jgi:hypothetical protein
MPATRLSDYHFGSTKRRERRMVKMAQDEEFGGFYLSDKGFVLAPQLLWLKRFLEEYLGLLQDVHRSAKG